MKHLTISPSSCIVVMVHVVKGRQHSACTVDIDTRERVKTEVRPAVSVRASEGNTLLVKLLYSLDTSVRYSRYLLIFKSHKGSIEFSHK
jgi:hypothetical protein